jgi:hypothetical protein
MHLLWWNSRNVPYRLVDCPKFPKNVPDQPTRGALGLWLGSSMHASTRVRGRDPRRGSRQPPSGSWPMCFVRRVCVLWAKPHSPDFRLRAPALGTNHHRYL